VLRPRSVSELKRRERTRSVLSQRSASRASLHELRQAPGPGAGKDGHTSRQRNQNWRGLKLNQSPGEAWGTAPPPRRRKKKTPQGNSAVAVHNPPRFTAGSRSAENGSAFGEFGYFFDFVPLTGASLPCDHPPEISPFPSGCPDHCETTCSGKEFSFPLWLKRGNLRGKIAGGSLRSLTADQSHMSSPLHLV